ncbi:hypothetical protein [Sphingopyxis sp. DBS4]|uniref:hypothetical protein n=1 Tax=Sphingopyxis sp. DBS4 TaxID=2968500 RepID=UPI00214AC982|nr:hypothetical protein [Sphingopyxis sp. DBS4]
MINQLRKRFRSLADDFFFMIHDGRARQVAASQAAIDYATDELENSLADARAELAVERERLFGQKIRAARAELDAGRRQQSRLTHELSVFQTDYPAKIKAKLQTLNLVRHELSLVVEAIEQARGDVAEAKHDIDRWHRRANSRLPLYGKHGKEIPNHRFFSFSKADLRSAHQRRETAQASLDGARSERDAVKSRMRGCQIAIRVLNADRNLRRKLIAEGHSCASIRRDLDGARVEVERLEAWEQSILQSECQFCKNGPQARSILAIEAQISEQFARRKERMALFDTPEERARRRARYSDQTA